MPLHLSIQELIAEDGSAATLEREGLVVVVGANNSGKSRLLRDIAGWGNQYMESPVTLSDVNFRREPEMLDINDLPDLIEGIAVRERSIGNGEFTYRGISGGSEFELNQLAHNWNRRSGLQNATSVFMRLMPAGSLGAISSQMVTGEDIVRGGSLVSRLVSDGESDGELSRLCQKLFGFPLTFDRITGQFQYRVGRPDVEAPRFDNPTNEYREAVAALPLLGAQGDGVKGFLGLAITVIASEAAVLLVDEPEAFLHPPQSRALGAWSARAAHRLGKQIVVATHDRDFVLGALDADQGVHIVRISRLPDGRTHLNELSAARVRELWEDPVLRYSNVLQGMFHEQTVIAESDADCRFYRAVLDVAASSDSTETIASETLFVPSHGKDRVALMARALSAAGVRPRAILDFDVLRITRQVKEIVDAVGGVWGLDLESDYKALRDWANREQNWEQMKKLGVGALRGEVRAATDRLLAGLTAQGLLIVPVGEMEDLEPSVGQQKGAWVREMLESKRYLTCASAIELVSPLLDRRGLPPEPAVAG